MPKANHSVKNGLEIVKIKTELTHIKKELCSIKEEQAKAQLAIDKANGNQKLLDLGLLQAEATAMTGYTPPVE